VQPIPTAGYPLPARRPANSRMSNRMLELRYGLSMPAWDSQLQLVMNEAVGEIKPLPVAAIMAAQDTRH